ncbi:MAG: ABC-F family ATP-binding cassette domain-containing protein [Polyangiales bacterium]
MPVLVATDLVKSFGTRVLLDGVSVSIRSGERVGLVGNNGSGKSSLARILAGLDTPDSGTVAVRRSAEVEYLEQEPALDPDATALAIVESGLAAWKAATARHEAASAALAKGEGDLDAHLAAQAEAAADVERHGGWDAGHEARSMLAHLGIADPSRTVGTMSGGEKRRVALARLLVASPALAILDEPTNHLDVDTIEWLEEYLAESFRGALLLVTHDRYFLDRVVERTLELENGRLHSYDGGWDRYLEMKAERLAHEERVEANRKNFLRTELDWLRRSPAARTTKQKARVERANAALSETGPTRERTVSLSMDTTRLGGTILDLDHVGIELAGRTLIRELTLSLRKGERIGIVGPNGAGKTTLLRLLTGELSPTRGQVVLGKNTRIAYFDQGRSGLLDDKSIQENVAGDRTKLDLGGETVDVRTYLSRFLFAPERLRTRVGALSGGERARVSLAKLLLSPANLLLLDEPTNDLDVATLSSLESMIVEANASALVVSHDRYFLDRVATGILAFEGDGKVVLYQGNYETYRSLRAQAEAASRASEPPPAKPTPKVEPEKAPEKAKKGLTYKERIELEGILPAIEKAEAELATLEAELGDPEVYAKRAAEVPALVAKRDRAKEEVERLVERWSDLEARREG